MSLNIGIVVDNELIDDKRVLRETYILKEYGYNIFIICFGFDGKSYPDISGINITRIKISKRLKNALFLFQNLIPLYEFLWSSVIKKFVKENNISILHTHDLYLSRSAYIGIHKSKKKIPLVLDLHENYPYAVQTYNWTKGLLREFISCPSKWQSLEAEYLRYPDKIIVLSDEFKEDLLVRYKFLKENEFCVFPNVPDLAQMGSFTVDKSFIKFKKTTPVILYFGIIAERRGIFDALEAFSNVVGRGYKALFLIIGPIDKKDKMRFFNYINSAVLKDHIIYIPWIDLSELPTYLDASDICLAPFVKNPQHESGVANKIYDYMLGRKAVIASDCRPQKNLIEKYNCGLIFRNIIELQDSIIKLLENRDLRIKMGENGYEAIINDHHTGIVKSNLLKCYRGLSETWQHSEL